MGWLYHGILTIVKATGSSLARFRESAGNSNIEISSLVGTENRNDQNLPNLHFELPHLHFKDVSRNPKDTVSDFGRRRRLLVFDPSQT